MGEISGTDEQLGEQPRGNETGDLAAPPNDAGGSAGDTTSGVAEGPQGSAPSQTSEAPKQTPSLSPGPLPASGDARPAEIPPAQNNPSAPAQRTASAPVTSPAARGAQLAKEIEDLSKTAPNSPEYYVRLARYFSVPPAVVSMFPTDFALRFATEQYQKSLQNSAGDVAGTNQQGGDASKGAKDHSALAEAQEKMLRGPLRKLTPGEMALLGQIFKGSMEYDQVRIHHKKWSAFQADDRAMSPDGETWYSPVDKDYSDDFSKENLDDATAAQRVATFIHEMTHVWQKQSGIPVIQRGLLNRDYSYVPGEDFNNYGIEAQAKMVEDYFLLKNGWIPNAKYTRTGKSPTLPELETSLKDLLANPSYLREQNRGKFGASTRN